MTKLAFEIPSGIGNSTTQLEAPKGIPDQLKGGLNTTGVNLMQLVLQYFFLAGIFLAVVMILFSGIQLVTSGGETEKIRSAKKRLTMAIVGLIVMSSAFFIVKTVITISGGSPDFFFRAPSQ